MPLLRVPVSLSPAQRPVALRSRMADVYQVDDDATGARS